MRRVLNGERDMCPCLLQSSMRAKLAPILLAWLAISISFAPASADSGKRGGLTSGGIIVADGNAVLVEVHTATWCPTCADFDDIVPILRREHDGRIALMNLHPSDGVDLLSSPASTHRLERLHMNLGRITGTPSIFMESQLTSEGAMSGSQFTTELFSAEANLRDRSDLRMHAFQSGDILTVTIAVEIESTNTFSDTQLAILVGNDAPVVDTTGLPVGAGPFDASLHSLLEVELDVSNQTPNSTAFPSNKWGLSNFQATPTSISFSAHLLQNVSLANQTTIVGIHEVVEERIANTSIDTLSAIAIYQDHLQSSTNSAWIWLVGGCILLGILILAEEPIRTIGKKKHLDESE